MPLSTALKFPWSVTGIVRPFACLLNIFDRHCCANYVLVTSFLSFSSVFSDSIRHCWRALSILNGGKFKLLLLRSDKERSILENILFFFFFTFFSIFLLLAIQEVYINNCKNNIYRKKFISGINETNFQFLLYTFSHNTR